MQSDALAAGRTARLMANPRSAGPRLWCPRPRGCSTTAGSRTGSGSCARPCATRWRTRRWRLPTGRRRPTIGALWEAELKVLPTHTESRLWLVSGLLLPLWDRLPTAACGCEPLPPTRANASSGGCSGLRRRCAWRWGPARGWQAGSGVDALHSCLGRLPAIPCFVNGRRKSQRNRLPRRPSRHPAAALALLRPSLGWPKASENLLQTCILAIEVLPTFSPLPTIGWMGKITRRRSINGTNRFSSNRFSVKFLSYTSTTD